VKPHDVLRAQADLLAALGTPTHRAYAGTWFARHVGAEDELTTEAVTDLGRQWCESTIYTVQTAATYLIDTEAVPLIRRAAADLPETVEVQEHDLPSPAGFAMFADPYELVDIHGRTRYIRVITWQVVDDEALRRLNASAVADGFQEVPLDQMVGHGCVIVQFWTSFRDLQDGYIAEAMAAGKDFAALLGDLTIAHQVSIPMALRLGDWDSFREAREIDDDASASAIFGAVALWMLMRQPVIAADPVELQPRTVRQWQRKRIPGQITVVRLRHRVSEAAPQPTAGQTAAAWSCRWRVRGHWHRYRTGAGRTNMAWRYVHDYEKGPEGLPLREAPRKVYRVTGEPPAEGAAS
jgi:hypothetical protein